MCGRTILRGLTALATALLLVSGCDNVTPPQDPGVDPPPSPPPEPAWAFHQEPVLVPPSDAWDAAWAIGPTVIRWEGMFRMWYMGSTNERYPYAPGKIGYATSQNGTFWTRHGDGPVLVPRPAEWDSTTTTRPVVLADGDTLRMWYAGGGHVDDSDIGYAASVDGVNWTRLPAPVLVRGEAGEWNRLFVSPGAVIKEDGTFKMWFDTSMDEPARGGIGYATSPDGIQWTVYNNPATTEAPYRFSDPVLLPGADTAWDARIGTGVSVVRTEGGYEMFYTAWAPHLEEGFRIGHATSPDGVNWEKNARNPVLSAPPDWSVTPQFNSINFPSVILDGDRQDLWFSVWRNDVPRGVLGYATRRVP